MSSKLSLVFFYLGENQLFIYSKQKAQKIKTSVDIRMFIHWVHHSRKHTVGIVTMVSTTQSVSHSFGQIQVTASKSDV